VGPTIVLTVIGGLTRLWDVGSKTDNGAPLFDEKYYAVQVAEVVRNYGVEDNQGYGVVVHSPLGKQLIGIGEHLLDYTPTGWRLASIVAGTFVIFLTVRLRPQDDQIDPDGRPQLRDVPHGPAGRLPGSVLPGRVRLPDRRPRPHSGQTQLHCHPDYDSCNWSNYWRSSVELRARDYLTWFESGVSRCGGCSV